MSYYSAQNKLFNDKVNSATLQIANKSVACILQCTVYAACVEETTQMLLGYLLTAPPAGKVDNNIPALSDVVKRVLKIEAEGFTYSVFHGH